jgi:hypothetical protein
VHLLAHTLYFLQHSNNLALIKSAKLYQNYCE